MLFYRKLVSKVASKICLEGWLQDSHEYKYLRLMMQGWLSLKAMFWQC